MPDSLDLPSAAAALGWDNDVETLTQWLRGSAFRPHWEEFKRDYIDIGWLDMSSVDLSVIQDKCWADWNERLQGRPTKYLSDDPVKAGWSAADHYCRLIANVVHLNGYIAPFVGSPWSFKVRYAKIFHVLNVVQYDCGVFGRGQIFGRLAVASSDRSCRNPTDNNTSFNPSAVVGIENVPPYGGAMDPGRLRHILDDDNDDQMLEDVIHENPLPKPTGENAVPLTKNRLQSTPALASDSKRLKREHPGDTPEYDYTEVLGSRTNLDDASLADDLEKENRLLIKQVNRLNYMIKGNAKARTQLNSAKGKMSHLQEQLADSIARNKELVERIGHQDQAQVDLQRENTNLKQEVETLKRTLSQTAIPMDLEANAGSQDRIHLMDMLPAMRDLSCAKIVAQESAEDSLKVLKKTKKELTYQREQLMKVHEGLQPVVYGNDTTFGQAARFCQNRERFINDEINMREKELVVVRNLSRKVDDCLDQLPNGSGLRKEIKIQRERRRVEFLK